jgi:acetolactate synthase-1/2/3 large subunit
VTDHSWSHETPEPSPPQPDDSTGLAPRNGGDLVVETLTALGARSVVGIPGQHALGLFDALSRSSLAFYSFRVENNAAFAADGYSRASGQVGVLFLSTGPGALTSLAGLQEAYATCVPLVVIASQIPREGLGARHKGMIHQLDEQKESARNVTKSQFTVQQAASIPAVIHDAWEEALTAPQGPVWVEIPQDTLLEPTVIPPVADVHAQARPVPARAELVAEAARLLGGSSRPAVLAGGGVRRSGPDAEAALADLAELLDAPVVCTPGGNSAFPSSHRLSLGSWVEDRYVTEVLEEADVLLVVGSSLGEVTSNYYTLAPRGSVIQIDADYQVLESNHAALGIRSDAGPALADLHAALTDDGVGKSAQSRADWGGASSEQLVAAVREKVERRLSAQDLSAERQLLADIRAAVPQGCDTFWDMTIAAYWAWNCWSTDDGAFHSAQGAGGLGFGFPGALGGAIAAQEQAALSAGPHDRGPQRTVAVAGDGSAMYSIAELATARQYELPVTWLIIDDGGYGILRQYMDDTFGRATATELAGPDFVRLAQSFGVPAEDVSPDQLKDGLARACEADGPNVVIVRTELGMWEPSHLTDPLSR